MTTQTNKFDDVLEMVKLTQQLRGVERIVLFPQSERLENDLEHSAQISLVALYLLDSRKLPLNRELVLQYALVHDLVEVYAGDTYFYNQQEPGVREQKEAKEKAALERLRAEFPDWEALPQLVEAYEQKQDPEAVFVYALDKVLPIMNIYLDHGRSWQQAKLTLEEIDKNKKPKAELDSVCGELYAWLYTRLKAESSVLFTQ